jgi:hypothetical protein
MCAKVVNGNLERDRGREEEREDGDSDPPRVLV